MKRILGIMIAGLFGFLLSVGSASAASSDCLNIKFDNGDSVCLGITKSGTRNFKVSIDKNNLSRTPTLMCYLTLPDGHMYQLGGCQGTFTYAGSSTQAVLLSATYINNSSDIFYNRLSTSINFKNGTWGSSSRTINSGEGTDNGKSSSKSSNEIELSTNRKSPTTSQYVNLTVSTDKKYTGKLYLSAKYRSSSSSSWSSISNTSSTYFSSYSSEWSNGYYKMVSSDKGNITLSNLIKFKKNGYYRVYVRDIDGNESYIQFNVGNVDNNNELKVSASPSSPDTYEWVKLTIKTDEDYVGKVNFSKFQYRSNSSSSWSNISRTSSTYVSDYSTTWSNGYYKMTSPDDGEVILKNLVKFKKSGYYRIYVEDTNGNESYIQISVDTSSSSSSSDEIELSTNRKTPTTSQYVNLTIETDEDYIGKLSFSTKYRSSSSNSWTTISNTSSTYFSDYSDEWDNGYYKMKSSDDGEVTLKNLVKFRKNGYYRIYVKDTSGNESYIQFNVGDVDDEDDEDDNSKVSGFSSSELNKIKTVYKNWNSMIAEMQRKYPALKKDTYWVRLSNNLYDDLKDVVNNKKVRDFQDYDDFQDAFDDWYDYTMRNI